MRLDLHVHTRYSADCINPPWLIMKILRKRGLDGLAVADHNTIRGWRSMREAARKYGLHLILGEEIKTYVDGRYHGEVLALFLNEGIRKGSPGEVIDSVRQQGGIVVISHPFDRAKGFRNLGEFLGKIDAVECLNARLPSMKVNERALNFAKKHGLGMTGGSDAHIPLEVGLACTEADCNDLEGFRKALKKRQTRFSGRMDPPLIHLSGIPVLVFRKAGGIL
jgi:predicted metal-dependent phosphoesterase TrpH